MSLIIHSQSPSRDDEMSQKAIQLAASLEVCENEDGAIEATDFIGNARSAIRFVFEHFSNRRSL